MTADLSSLDFAELSQQFIAIFTKSLKEHPPHRPATSNKPVASTMFILDAGDKVNSLFNSKGVWHDAEREQVFDTIMTLNKDFFDSVEGGVRLAESIITYNEEQLARLRSLSAMVRPDRPNGP